ncbi:MAG: hypothetical protein KDJ17_02120 [Hyphomicrobiaceae bacterium]|nr:hypothetical protein [Hyphomicrobiaceae bacterium]
MVLRTEEAKSGAARPPVLSAEDESKDRFFREIATISEAMIAAHGPDFAMGVLILGARFIAENKSFSKASEASQCCGNGCHDHSHHHHDHKS